MSAHYLGAVVAEWLDDGRTMQLREEFVFVDQHGVRWHAPSWSCVDGASIPKFLWSLIGGPFEGKYRRASVLHDVYCVTRTRPWSVTHRMFYEAMRRSFVNQHRAHLMFMAVWYFGPRWDAPSTPPLPVPDIQLRDWWHLEQFLGDHAMLSEDLIVKILPT